MNNINKNNKLTNEIVLVGFQTYEYDQYKYVNNVIQGLSFEQAIDKLVDLNVWFKPFYKYEHTLEDLDIWKENYYYIIKIENNNN